MSCKDIAREILGIPCGESGVIEGRIRELATMATSRHGKLRCLLDRLVLRESYMPLGLASVGFLPVVLFLIYPYYHIPTPYLIVIGVLYSLAVLITGWSMYYYVTRQDEPTTVAITLRPFLTCQSLIMRILLVEIFNFVITMGHIKVDALSGSKAEMRLRLGCDHSIRISCSHYPFIVAGTIYVDIWGSYKREIADIVREYLRNYFPDATVTVI
jgi:hypothetical protein